MVMKKIGFFKDNYNFLSNFAPCQIVYEGILYPSTEHAYQAAKTLNLNERKAIAQLPTVGMAKRRGQKVQKRDDWDEVKTQVMYDCCVLKFTQPYFRAQLLATEDSYLEEGNQWHDNWYGVCHCGGCPPHRQQPPENQNHLGKILMQIREILINKNNGIIPQ